MATLTLPADRWTRPCAASLPPATPSRRRHRARPWASASPTRSSSTPSPASSAKALPVVKQTLPIVEQRCRSSSRSARSWPAGRRPAVARVAAAARDGAPSPTSGRCSPSCWAVQTLNRGPRPVPRPSGTGTGAGPGARRHRRRGRRRWRSLATSAPHRYSYASFAPLLAALPALAPSAGERADARRRCSRSSPLRDPNKLMKTMFAGLAGRRQDRPAGHRQAARAPAGAQPRARRRRAHPAARVDVDGSRRESTRAHELSRRVSLGSPTWPRSSSAATRRWPSADGDDISLPVTVDTDRPIPRPTLRARVKDAGTLAAGGDRAWRLRPPRGRSDPAAGRAAGVAHRAARPGREYLVDLALTWQGRSGLVGATTCQLIRIVGAMTVSTRWTPDGAPVRLDDVDGDRDWWHRVWSGTSRRLVRRRPRPDSTTSTGSATWRTNRRAGHRDRPRRRQPVDRLRGTISSGRPRRGARRRCRGCAQRLDRLRVRRRRR